MIKGEVIPLPNHVLVEDMEEGARVVNGVIIMDDNGKDRGIRPRWAKVHAVGHKVTDIKPGQWVLVEHGQWTYRTEVVTAAGKKFIQRINYPDGVLVVGDKPDGDWKKL